MGRGRFRGGMGEPLKRPSSSRTFVATVRSTHVSWYLSETYTTSEIPLWMMSLALHSVGDVGVLRTCDVDTRADTCDSGSSHVRPQPYVRVPRSHHSQHGNNATYS